MEIDDKWSTEYGDLEFDAAKFPNARAMTDLLHRLGFEVTLWVTPWPTPWLTLWLVRDTARTSARRTGRWALSLQCATGCSRAR